ncbi:fibronectin type III domain-containing protein [Tenacibaculum sp. TC6]|uniref:fibronectin type III domain-containing protein n=1 Tax=Tenacibaculum sp. TC6 TaxID=3423223 RepID=UPI003D35F0AC
MKRLLPLIFTLFTIVQTFYAQQYPVTIVPRVNAPAPVNFFNYADETSLNSPITVQIFLNDITVTNRQIRLKTYFEGGNISFRSKDFVLGAEELFLEGGVPLTLRNTELAPYYKFENIEGINTATYSQTIPEGSYNFCFEVYDYLSGAKLSAKKCATVFIFKNEPPILNLPFNGANIEPKDFETIVFQWTPRHINVSNVEYEFSMVEIWDNYVNPQTAFLSQVPIYEETTRRTSIVYGPDKPLLLPSKRYAWRVKAKALQGVEEIGLFKNQGYSEVFWFSRTLPCQPPDNVSAEPKGTSKINVFWDQDPTVHSEFIIAYREADKQDAQWFTKRTNSSWATIWDLKSGTTYEYKVKGKCQFQYSEYSEVQRVTTETSQNEDANYQCGIVPDAIAISNRQPHPGLSLGDVITAGNFKVTITEIQGQSNGVISGKGYVAIPYLKFAKFGVTFNSILVNSSNQLAEGEIVTLYDPAFGEGASATVDVDVNISEGINGDSGELEDAVTVDFVIDSIEIDANGAIVVTGTNGETATIPGDDDVNIVSSNGDVWSVGEDGTITQQTGAEGGAVVDGNTNGVGADGNVTAITATGVKVTFKNSGYYYFDALPEGTSSTFEKEYKIITTNSGDYKIPYKAISDTNGDDFIEAKVEINDSSITKEDIIFKTKDGAKIEVEWLSNDTAKLKLKRKYHYVDEEIFAVVKSKDNSEKFDIGGSIVTTHLASQKLEAINVTLIPVGIASIDNQVKEQVKEIYRKAGVRLNIQEANKVDLEEIYGWDIDKDSQLKVGDSSVLSHYTDEEGVFNSYVKKQNYYSKTTYYVFVTDVPISKSEIAGFMPLKRQFGFVFTRNANTVEKQARTLAHELGHGIFGLQHTWDEYKFPQGATQFLMDYGNGTVLNHLDWKKMHAPGIQLYWFQGDEEGEQISTSLADFKNFVNRNEQGKEISYSFITPSLEVVSIPLNSNKVTFSTLDPYFYSNNVQSGNYAPVGSLLHFEVNGEKFSFTGVNDVYAYRNNKGDKYKDVLTKNTSKNEAIIALPVYDFNNKKIKLSVNKYDIKSNQVISGDFDSFSNVSDKFCVVEEYNEPEKFDIKKLSTLFKNNVVVDDVTHNKLTPFAKEYLDFFSPQKNKDADLWNLTFYQNEFSPVIISAALAYASNEAVESFIQCHLIDAINQQEKERREINSMPYETTGWSLLFTFRTYAKTKVPEALIRSYLDYYLKDLRELIKLPESIVEIQSQLSSDKLDSLTSKELVPLVMESSNCTIEQISFEDRIKIIKKILERDNSYFNDDEEDALVKLINSTVFNNQSELLVAELFNEENSKLFTSLWDDLHFSEYHEYINKVTELITLEGINKEVKEENKFSFSTDNRYNFDYNFKGKELEISYVNKIDFKISKKTFQSLDEIVEITIPKENSYVEWGESKLTEDKVLRLPAYYIAYLLQKKSTEDNFTAVRVIGNLIAIATAIPTGGGSITVAGALTIAISSADLIMTFSESHLKNLDGGKEFIKAWEVITLIDGINGLARVGISITKNTAGQISKIKIDLPKFKANIRSLKNVKGSAFDEIRKIPALLTRMKQLPSEIIFNKRLVLEIEQVIISEKFLSQVGKELRFNNGIEGLVDNIKVFDIQLASTGGFLKFKTLKESYNSVDSFLGKLDNIRYAEGSKIKEGTFLLFKGTDGIVYAVKDINYFIPDLLKGARNNVRNVYGNEYVDIFLKQKFKENQGAAAVIIDKFGAAGKKILDDVNIKNLDDAAKALVKDKDIMRFYSEHMDRAYRAVNETSYNFDKLKSTGVIEAAPEAFPTYISLDNFLDADKAKDILQLPKKPTWVAEFTIDQVVNDLRFPKGKFNKGDYTEVLTQAFPNWGKGGGTQFLTNAKIKVSTLRNLITGEVIKFTHLVYKTDFAKHLKEVEAFSQKRAITGGHNLADFNNYLINNNIEINRLGMRSGSVDGISELTYQIKKADGSGGWKATEFKKTLYDPSKLSDQDMIKYGKEAMDEGILSNRMIVQPGSNTIIKGESSNGIKFLGYRDPVTLEIKNFHPVINY